MSKTCRDCFHFYGVAEDMNGEVGMCDLQSSEYPNYKVAGGTACDKFNAQTVFDRITASPEVLAEKLVFCAEYKTIRPMYVEGKGGIVVAEIWKSTIIPEATFSSESEAIAATVERLKEVVK